MRSRRVVALVLVVALGVGACGTDDAGQVADGIGSGTTQTAGPAGDDRPNATGGPQATARPTTTEAPTTTEPPPTTTAPPPTTTAPPTTTTAVPPPPPPPAPPEPPVEQGPTSLEIGLVQLRLTELGYRPGAPTGVDGPQTSSAVMAFQKREGLGRDGIAGPETISRLAAPQGAGPRRGGPGPWVEVDITRQVVFVADPGGAVFTLNTSTGSGQSYRSGGTTAIARTPRGAFVVYRTVNALEHGPLGSLYRPMYFTGGYALHGSPSVPAYPASHGCVRLSNADADWLWGFAGRGTTVDVYD